MAEYGTKAIAKGLRKLGMDEWADKMLRQVDDVIDDVDDGIVDNVDDGIVDDGQWLVHNTCVKFSAKQVQKKFRHASDFGITGTYSKHNHTLFISAMDTHIHGPNTVVINGTYRSMPAVHYYDPMTDLVVLTHPDGSFWSGWKIGGDQKIRFLT